MDKNQKSDRMQMMTPSLLLTLSLETLVLCMVEEALHDGAFELDRVVDLEGIVRLP